MLGTYIFTMFLSSWWILPLSTMTWPSGSVFMALFFKVYFVSYECCYPGFFSPVHLLGIFVSSPSLSVCVGLLSWGGSLVGSICVGHVFLSIQLFYVFWLEYLNQLHLRLLLIGTYSLPFFHTCVPLSLTLFLPFLKTVPSELLQSWFGGDVFF